MGNDPISSVAPGENSARIAALGKNAEASAMTAAQPSVEEQSISAQSQAAVLAAQVNQLPEVRQEKIAAIANAVKRGTYQVSPEQTADAILSELDARTSAAA